MRLSALLIFLSGVTACNRASSTEEYYLMRLTLPDSSVILMEQMRTPEQMTQGMMFRDELRNDRGMLFSHAAPGRFPYWMCQVKVPLDIIWVNTNRRIVEIVPQAKPCEKGPASACPSYGGHQDSLFVVELAGGVAAKHGLKVGDLLTF